MLEKEADKIDAVLVSTPDHNHAPAAAMALRLKKHVYCEKPLTHTVLESRTLAELARKNNLITQMGTQMHAGENYRRVVELIQSGAIGQVREVHVWDPSVHTGARFTTGTPAPKTSGLGPVARTGTPTTLLRRASSQSLAALLGIRQWNPWGYGLSLDRPGPLGPGTSASDLCLG